MKKYNQYIPGIHNFCDQWCERCNFRKRCMSYQQSANMEPVGMDMNNDSFWEAIARNHKKTETLLFDEAAQQGIDADRILQQNVDAARNGGLESFKKNRELPLGKISFEYILDVDLFFKKHSIIQKKSDELMQGMNSGLRTVKETRKEVKRINGCFDVIFEYLLFIHKKLMRALFGLTNDDGWEETNGHQRDCDGSAKIAMIASQRSLDSWKTLSDLIPGYEDEILPILGKLESLIRMTEEAFPKAKDFIRPGFDEPSKN